MKYGNDKKNLLCHRRIMFSKTVSTTQNVVGYLQFRMNLTRIHAAGCLKLVLQQLGAEKIAVETYLPFANGGSRISQIMKMSAQHLAERYVATGLCSLDDVDRYIAAADDPSAWAYYYTTVATIGRKPQ